MSAIKIKYQLIMHVLNIEYPKSKIGEQGKKKGTSQKVYFRRGKNVMFYLKFHGQEDKSLKKTFRVKK